MMLRVQHTCQESHRWEDVQDSVSSVLDKDSASAIAQESFQKPSTSAVVLTNNDNVDTEMSDENEEEVNQGEENGDAEEDFPGSDSMTDSCTTGYICDKGTTRNTADKKSFSSEIKMNELDEAEALDRLLFDLSNDEVSMVIDLFGKEFDIGKTTKKPTSSLPPYLQTTPKNAKDGHNVIPVSQPHHLQEKKKENDIPKVVEADTNVGQNQPFQRIPNSLFQYDHPAIQHMMFKAMTLNAMHITPHGPYGMYTSVSTPRPGYVSPSFVVPVAKQAADENSISEDIDSVKVMEVTREQIAEKGDQRVTSRPKAPSKESLPPHPLPKSPSEVSLHIPEKKKAACVSNGPINKRQPKPAVPSDVLPTAVMDDTVSPNNEVTTITRKKAEKKTKVAPARKKKTNTKKSKPKNGAWRRRTTQQHEDTYITFPKSKLEDRWAEHFKGAQEFRKQHGHCRIPTTYKPNPGLANWAKRQRYHIKNFKKHFLDRPDNPAVVMTRALPNRCFPLKRPGMRIIKCHMTMERLEQLEAIDFCSSLHDTSWERMYARLCYFSKRNGGCVTPSKYTDVELWRWCGTQRYQMKKQRIVEKEEKEPTGAINPFKWYPRLTQERIDKLNKINFVWDDKSAASGRKDK